MVVILHDRNKVIKAIQQDARDACKFNTFMQQELHKNPWRYFSEEWMIWESTYASAHG